MARTNRQGSHTPLQGSNPLLKNIGGWIHNPRVNIPEFLQGEKIRRMFRILEKVSARLING